MIPLKSNLIDRNDNQAAPSLKLELINSPPNTIPQAPARSEPLIRGVADEINKLDNRLVYLGNQNIKMAAKILMINTEKSKIAAKLVIANHELMFERKERECRTIELVAAKEDALNDCLTKLPNRRLFSDRFNQAMLSSRRSKSYSAIIFIDLDKFKLVNDCYGHGVGDFLLREVAGRIQKSIRDTDTVARFGGDEFVVLLTQLNKDQTTANSEAALISEKIRSAIDIPVMIDFGEEEVMIHPQCTASFGVTLFLYTPGETGVILKKILNLADKSMYRAKNRGGNSVQF